MIEKRRSKRLPVKIEFTISDLYKQANNGFHNLSLPIEIIDISKYGFGFISECILPIHYYINAQSEFEQTNLPLFTDVKIIHDSAIDKFHYRYGAEFINLSIQNELLLENYIHNIE